MSFSLKKTVSVVVSFVMVIASVLFFDITVFAEDDTEEPEYALDSVLVLMDHEHSAIGTKYENMNYFQSDLIESVRDVMYLPDDCEDLSLFNVEEFQQVVEVKLKEPSVENVDRLIAELSQYEGVESVDKNYIYKIEVPEISSYKLMDVNGDGKITVADARLALRAVAKLDIITDRCQYAVDIDDDGKLSGTEARAIMRVAAGLADETITIQELCGYYIDQVGIVLKSEYSLCPSKVYEPEYFSDMIERTYNSAYITPDTKEYFADDFQQIIILYLKEPSRDNVKKAMKEIKDKNLIDVDIVDICGFGYIYPA